MYIQADGLRNKANSGRNILSQLNIKKQSLVRNVNTYKSSSYGSRLMVILTPKQNNNCWMGRFSDLNAPTAVTKAMSIIKFCIMT